MKEKYYEFSTNYCCGLYISYCMDLLKHINEINMGLTEIRSVGVKVCIKMRSPEYG